MIKHVQKRSHNQIQTQKMSQSTILSCRVLEMGEQELSDFLRDTAMSNPLIELDSVMLHQRSSAKAADSRRAGSYPADDYYGKFGKTELDTDLRHHLRLQLPGRGFTSNEHAALLYIIESLDERGYFTESEAILAKRFFITEKRAAELLSVIQSMDPEGVGARTLSECLLLQLKAKYPNESFLSEIVRDCMDEISKNQLKRIESKTGRTLDEVLHAMEIIRTLNPRPCEKYSVHKNNYIRPDVIVRNTDSGYIISLDTYGADAFHIDESYYSALCSSGEDDVRQYVSEQYKSASTIKQCIESRRKTLLRVSECIFTKQKKFFYGGKQYLLPLTLQDVASELEIHKSTVSRAIKNKFLQCQWGVFELKYFFSNKLPSSGIEGDSYNAKSLLLRIIDEEQKCSPYSDQKLCELLAQEGISISRRTVTKYREAAGIKNAAGRKDFASDPSM